MSRSDKRAKSRQHPIFLSHSGHDKPFVRRLYDALRDAGHDPFFDTHSLPAGEPFPAYILENASGCRLGVVVLSPQFLTSPWPMMELHSMYESLSAPTILPLFFKLRPSDVKLSSPLFAEWRSAWEALAIESPCRVKLAEWEAAITSLPTLSGVVYEPHKGEDVFIEKAVNRICSIVRPLQRYMVSHLIGRDRLTQEVATLFEDVSSSHFEARAIGLHGIAGQGKTSICKLMVNHYASAYAGRCTVIEFPSGDGQEASILNQFKKALQQLTNISEHRIARVDDLDQCLQLLKERVEGLNVFIAIDNIWEKYLEYAQRIVDVLKFNKESKLLATSRSRQVLISLLEGSESVRLLPSVSREEAHQIFINSFGRNHCGGVDLEESYVDDATECFHFQHQYHPLGIKALGVALGRMEGGGLPATRDEMSQFFGSNDNAVSKAIRINYDSLPKTWRELFLDVALIYIPMIQGRHSIYVWAKADIEYDFDHLLLWLTALYSGRMNKWEILRSLTKLAYNGLFEFEISSRSGRKEVHVHDLYTELAIQEGAANGRFLVGGKNIRDEDIKYAEVERIVLEADYDLRREPMPNSQLLMAKNLDCSGLEVMQGLRILEVQNKECNSRLLGWKNTPHLAWLELKAVTCEDVSELSNLCVLKLQGCSMPCTAQTLRLEGLVNLQVLEMSGIRGIQKITGLGRIPNLKIVTLINLQDLCTVDTKSLTELQVLEIEGCNLLQKNRKGMGHHPNLKALRCTEDWLDGEWRWELSDSLQALCLTNVKGSAVIGRSESLESLYLQYVGYRYHGGHMLPLFPSLKAVVLAGEIMSLGILGHLPSLEWVLILDCKLMPQIDWFSFRNAPKLKEIIICDCLELKQVVGDPGGLAHILSRLVIDGCPKFEEVQGLHLFTHCETLINGLVMGLPS